MKKKDQIAAYIKFGEEAPEYGKQYGEENLNNFYPEHKFRLKIFLDLLHLIKPNKILDIGCGSGQPLLSILKNGFNVNGFDFSPEMVEQSQKLLTENGFDPKFGARPIKRMLQKYVEDTLADLMVQGKIEEGSTVTLSYDSGKEADMQIPVKVKITAKKKPNQNDSDKH